MLVPWHRGIGIAARRHQGREASNVHYAWTWPWRPYRGWRRFCGVGEWWTLGVAALRSKSHRVNGHFGHFMEHEGPSSACSLPGAPNPPGGDRNGTDRSGFVSTGDGERDGDGETGIYQDHGRTLTFSRELKNAEKEHETGRRPLRTEHAAPKTAKDHHRYWRYRAVVDPPPVPLPETHPTTTSREARWTPVVAPLYAPSFTTVHVAEWCQTPNLRHHPDSQSHTTSASTSSTELSPSCGRPKHKTRDEPRRET